MADPALDSALSPGVARRVMLAADVLAQQCWTRVEKAYAGGLTLAEAKQRVLEEEVTRLGAATEGEVIDRVVQLVMETSHAGLGPVARRRHRAAMLARLSEPYHAAGGPPHGVVALWLYGRFGVLPRQLRRFWSQRGVRHGRVL